MDYSRPYVSKGLMTLPMRSLSIAGVRDTYGTDRVTVTRFLPGKAYHERETYEVGLGDYIDATKTPGKTTFYLADWPVFSLYPELRDLFEPLSRHFGDLRRTFMPDALRTFLGEGEHGFGWMLIGAKGSWYPCHQDIYFMHAWLAQIEGSKRVVCYPPTSGATPYTEAHESLVGRVEVVLEPGDVLFIPSGWWHMTRNMSRSLTVNANFVSWSIVPKFLRALRADLLDKVRG